MNKKHYENMQRVDFMMNKGRLTIIKQIAEQNKYTLSKLIRESLEETIKLAINRNLYKENPISTE